MTAPYDDSTQKEWKDRKDKIEGYYREMGQVGTSGNEKISSIIVATSGDKLVVQFSDGDGILYEIIEDLVSPLRMIKTLSNDEIEKFKKLTKCSVTSAASVEVSLSHEKQKLCRVQLLSQLNMRQVI